MQNKPNLEDATTNVKRYITIGYVNTIALGGPKNKPNFCFTAGNAENAE